MTSKVCNKLYNQQNIKRRNHSLGEIINVKSDYSMQNCTQKNLNILYKTNNIQSNINLYSDELYNINQNLAFAFAKNDIISSSLNLSPKKESLITESLSTKNTKQIRIINNIDTIKNNKNNTTTTKNNMHKSKNLDNIVTRSITNSLKQLPYIKYSNIIKKQEYHHHPSKSDIGTISISTATNTNNNTEYDCKSPCNTKKIYSTDIASPKNNHETINAIAKNNKNYYFHQHYSDTKIKINKNIINIHDHNNSVGISKTENKNSLLCSPLKTPQNKLKMMLSNRCTELNLKKFPKVHRLGSLSDLIKNDIIIPEPFLKERKTLANIAPPKDSTDIQIGFREHNVLKKNIAIKSHKPSLLFFNGGSSLILVKEEELENIPKEFNSRNMGKLISPEASIDTQPMILPKSKERDQDHLEPNLIKKSDSESLNQSFILQLDKEKVTTPLNNMNQSFTLQSDKEKSITPINNMNQSFTLQSDKEKSATPLNNMIQTLSNKINQQENPSNLENGSTEKIEQKTSDSTTISTFSQEFSKYNFQEKSQDDNNNIDIKNPSIMLPIRPLSYLDSVEFEKSVDINFDFDEMNQPIQTKNDNVGLKDLFFKKIDELSMSYFKENKSKENPINYGNIDNKIIHDESLLVNDDTNSPIMQKSIGIKDFISYAMENSNFCYKSGYKSNDKQLDTKKSMNFIINIIPPNNNNNNNSNNNNEEGKIPEEVGKMTEASIKPKFKYEFCVSDSQKVSKYTEKSMTAYLSEIESNELSTNLMLGSESLILSNIRYQNYEKYFSHDEIIYQFFNFFEFLARNKYPYILRDYHNPVKLYEDTVIYSATSLEVIEYKRSNLSLMKRCPTTRFLTNKISINNILNDDKSVKELRSVFDSQNIVRHQMNIESSMIMQNTNKSNYIEDEIEYIYNNKLLRLNNKSLIEPIRANGHQHRIWIDKTIIISNLDNEFKQKLIEKYFNEDHISHNCNNNNANGSTRKNNHSNKKIHHKNKCKSLKDLLRTSKNNLAHNKQHIRINSKIMKIINHTHTKNKIAMAQLVNKEYNRILLGDFENNIELSQYKEHNINSNKTNILSSPTNNFPTITIVSIKEKTKTKSSHLNNRYFFDEKTVESSLNTVLDMNPKKSPVRIREKSLRRNDEKSPQNLQHFKRKDEKSKTRFGKSVRDIIINEENDKMDKLNESFEIKPKSPNLDSVKKFWEEVNNEVINEIPNNNNERVMNESNIEMYNDCKKPILNEFNKRRRSSISIDFKKFNVNHNNISVLLKKALTNQLSSLGGLDDEFSMQYTVALILNYDIKLMKKNMSNCINNVNVNNIDDNKDMISLKTLKNYIQKIVDDIMKKHLSDKSDNTQSKQSSSSTLLHLKPFEIDDSGKEKEDIPTLNQILSNRFSLLGYKNLDMQKNLMLMRNHKIMLNKKKKANVTTKMFLTVIENKFTELEELFMHYPNFHIDTKDNKGNTLLCIAAQCGFLDIVNFLLARGADINLPNSNGNTPLHLALQYYHENIADILMKAGAAQNIKNNDGKSPWELCRYN